MCPNDRKVLFKKYQNKKNASGLEQSYKIYECEDCSGCPLKAKCTKAKEIVKFIGIRYLKK
ncbi:transposase [Bacillus sp. N9]